MAGLSYQQQREMEKVQPSGYADYMSEYGEHFSKRMCEWACSMMKAGKKMPDGTIKKERFEPWDKNKVDDLLTRYGIVLENDKGYDKVYVCNMGRADYLGRSVPDESHLAMYIKDVLDDPDGYDGQTFNRFVMDCMGSRTPIMWEDMM